MKHDFDSRLSRRALLGPIAAGGAIGAASLLESSVARATRVTQNPFGVRVLKLVDVTDYGATGNGIHDDAPNIQMALDYAWSQSSIVDPTTVPTRTMPTVYFPPGRYRLGASLRLYQSMILKGSFAGLFSDSTSFPLLETSLNGALQISIDGFIFSGGSNHLMLNGPRLDSSTGHLSDVGFMSCGDVCIACAPGETWPMHLLVERFKCLGPSLFRGSPDQAEFRDGWITFTTGSYCFETFTVLTLEDILGVPGPQTVAWVLMRGGRLTARSVRFGGEAVLSLVRALEPVIGADPTMLSFQDCAITCCAQRYWLDLEGRFPQLIHVKNCQFAETFGIYVDASITDEEIIASPQYAIHIDIDPLGAHTAHDMFFRASDPKSEPTACINDRLAQFTCRPPTETSGLVHPNEFLPGIYSSADIFEWQEGSTVNMLDAGIDTTTAYPLQILTATASKASYGRHKTWGEGLAAGTYVWSLYVRSTGAAHINLNYRHLVKSIPLFDTGGTYQRVHAVFFHDGLAGANLGWQFYDMPVGATVSVGLFCVNRGAHPSAYVFPGNPASVLEPRLHEAYASAIPSPPGAGTYKHGDIVWFTAPTPGGYIGCVCTASGSPGIWKMFGAIAL